MKHPDNSGATSECLAPGTEFSRNGPGCAILEQRQCFHTGPGAVLTPVEPVYDATLGIREVTVNRFVMRC